MPSQPHETRLLLFRNRPVLAAELLSDVFHLELPRFTEARLDSADLTDVQPARYRADLVVLLVEQVPVLGIIVEVQCAIDTDKSYAWPVYLATLRARLRCPACLLVVTTNERVARWASKPIALGVGSDITPLVLPPSGVPVITDEAQACADPELAVLSAMAHGRDDDIHQSVRIASAAQSASIGLDAERSRLYCDLILASLSEAARRELQMIDPAKYEYQSDIARHWFAHGQAEGRADVILQLLTLRFGSLNDEHLARLKQASLAELDEIAKRLLTAPTLRQALDP